MDEVERGFKEKYEELFAKLREMAYNVGPPIFLLESWGPSKWPKINGNWSYNSTYSGYNSIYNDRRGPTLQPCMACLVFRSGLCRSWWANEKEPTWGCLSLPFKRLKMGNCLASPKNCRQEQHQHLQAVTIKGCTHFKGKDRERSNGDFSPANIPLWRPFSRWERRAKKV